MIDIVGVIKVDASVLGRAKFLLASIKSLSNRVLCWSIQPPTFTLSIDVSDDDLFWEITKAVVSVCPNGHHVFRASSDQNYGQQYMRMLQHCKHEYVLNFIEDHFMMLDHPAVLSGCIASMNAHGIDVCKCSFHDIEQDAVHAMPQHILVHDAFGDHWINNEENFNAYQKFHTWRYYIGVNFLTSLAFAKKFWSRNFNSSRPHEWEVVRYDPSLEHTVMVPSVEILASIDDEHGKPGSNLLSRKDVKFWDIYNSITWKNSETSAG